MSFIEIINLNKVIGGKDILIDVNLKLERSKIYIFYGRNGSGKTMLCRAICGLIKPTSGEIKINGKTLHKDISFPESVGVIIESPGFWDYYTGFENLKILASIKNVITDDEIKNAIIRVGLDPEDNRIYKQYSMGMKQRLAIAQAIMERPDLLILDEPADSLDESGKELFKNLLMEEKARGTTILVALPDKEDTELIFDYRFKVANGKVMPEDTHQQENS
jgi:ABC-2 type transport system ATP-binding protein